MAIMPTGASSITWRKKMDSFRGVMERTDRVISSSSVDVSLVDNGPFPAWTDGEKIFLNSTSIYDTLMKHRGDYAPWIVTLKGMNYHELAHVLYSPRVGDEIMDWIQKGGVVEPTTGQRAFNILEDQRIEMLFTTKYPPSKRYFESVAADFLLDKGAAVTGQEMLLTWGRKFLDQRLRLMLRNMAEQTFGSALAAEAADVIDAYLPVVLPRDTLAAKVLIQRFCKVLERVGDVTNHYDGMTCACESRSGQASINNGRPRTKEQKRLSDQMQEQMQGSADDLNDGESGGKGRSKDGTGEGEGDESGGSGIGTSDVPSVPQWDDIAQAANEVKDDVMRDQRIRDDVKDMISAAKADADREVDAVGSRTDPRLQPLPGGAGAVVRQVKSIMQEYMVDSEPGWIQRENSGRLNVRRFMMAEAWQVDVFDRWDEGREEEVSTEVVILVDQSGSMSGMMYEVSYALWILKRAFDAVEVKSTVMGFSDSRMLLYGPNDRIDRLELPVWPTFGSTRVKGSLQEANRVLARSQRHNRALIILTDGEWDEGSACDYLIREMNGYGVDTMLIGMGRSYGGDTHGCTTYAQVKSAPQIVPLIKGMVERAIVRAVNNAV